MFDDNIIDGTPSLLLDFINYGLKETHLVDNPKFYDRKRDTNKACVNRFNTTSKNILLKLIEENADLKDILLKRFATLVSKLNNNTRCYIEPILDFKYFPNSAIEKIGYITYLKETMSWYDISDKLPELLSLLSGTSPTLIRFFIGNMLKDNNFEITVDEFSRHYLSDVNIPAGFSTKILSCMPPAVINFLNKLIDNGISNDFIIGGKSKIISTPFVVKETDNPNIYSWVISSDEYQNLDVHDLIDIYLCYSMRLFAYYILSCIYKEIANKYRYIWTPEGASRESLSEMLVSWTSYDIVFQNNKCQSFPSFKINGRGDASMIIKPYTYKIDDAIYEYLNGTLVL